LSAPAPLGRGDVGIDVNGQRQDNNNYLLDGISVTDLRNSELFNTPSPSPDAVQECKVPTSVYGLSLSWFGVFHFAPIM